MQYSFVNEGIRKFRKLCRANPDMWKWIKDSNMMWRLQRCVLNINDSIVSYVKWSLLSFLTYSACLNSIQWLSFLLYVLLATLFSQSSSSASAQQRSQTQVPSCENSPAMQRTKSSKRITARAGSRILAKFSRKNTVDESLGEFSIYHIRCWQYLCLINCSSWQLPLYEYLDIH